MIVRTLVTLVYIGAVAAALVLQFFFPTAAVWLLYGLLAWFVASLFVYRMPVMARSVGRPRPTPSVPVRESAPAPSPSSPPIATGPVTEPVYLDFCPYCAHAVEPGTPVCPECNHRIPVF